MGQIHFFEEGVTFKMPDIAQRKDWVEKVIDMEGFELGELNYILCSDEYLYQINQEYLNHDTYTDIITFDQSEDSKTIAGDIFVSIDRVRENATNLQQHVTDELDRVLIHGALHLMGYNDSSGEEKLTMRKKEEACLSLRLQKGTERK